MGSEKKKLDEIIYSKDLKISDFTVIGKVGEGTFGDVYRGAKKGDQETHVALKLLKENASEDGVSIALAREIEYLQTLNGCDNVVQLYDVFVHEDGRLIMSFEYIESDVLALLRNLRQPLEERVVKCFMRQLLIGLKECHDQNIMHRDIKTANLLIDRKGRLKIGDFGMASNTNTGREHEHNVVTIWYRAPELMMGERYYGAEIDMWSAGIVFSEMILRQAPFQTTGNSCKQMMSQIVKGLGKWEPVKNYPDYDRYDPIFKSGPTKNTFNQYLMPRMTPLGILLLNKMLDTNPNTRITATEALEHPYWNVEPLPCEPHEIPEAILVESHSYELSGRNRNIPIRAPKIKPPPRGEPAVLWGMSPPKKQKK